MLTLQNFLFNIPYFHTYAACVEYWKNQGETLCAEKLGDVYDLLTTIPCSPEDSVLLLPEPSDQYQVRRKLYIASLKEMRNLKMRFGVAGVIDKVNTVISECEKRENSQRIPVNFPTSPENSVFPSLSRFYSLRWEDLPGTRIYLEGDKRKKETIAAAILYEIMDIGGNEKEYNLTAEWREHTEKNGSILYKEESPKTFIEIENECREYRRVFGEIYKREIQNKHVLHPYHEDKWR